MAAYIRSVMFPILLERNAFLRRGNSIISESKRYVRGLRRKPVRVIFPDDVAEKDVKPIKSQPAEQNVRREAKVTAKPKLTEQDDFNQTRDNVRPNIRHAPDYVIDDPFGGLRFERAFSGDKRLAKVVSVARSRTFREHQGKILLEGRRLICDALNAGANPQMIFFSKVERIQELPVHKLKRATLVKVKFEDIKIWSDLVAPQGVIGIFSRPDPSRLNFANKGDAVPLSLICDNIRDPGNLGTMLRCAAAAGCDNVLLTKGCVDAWEPKVLRAAMGAHFHLPIYPNLSWPDVENYLPNSATVHVADSSCGAEKSKETEVSEVKTSRKPTKAEDYGWVSTKASKKTRHHQEYDSDSDSDSDSDGEYEGFSLPKVETRLYHESWAQKPLALVIGGETHGLSVEALRLAEKTSGNRLFIPVVPEMDSLNSAMAASILLFEGRKQLLKIMQTAGSKLKSKAKHQIT